MREDKRWRVIGVLRASLRTALILLTIPTLAGTTAGQVRIVSGELRLAETMAVNQWVEQV